MKLSEKSVFYCVFILGRDLLHEELKKLENDTAFEVCYKIIKMFDNSKEIDDMKLSCYEALEEYVKNNKKIIECIIQNKSII